PEDTKLLLVPKLLELGLPADHEAERIEAPGSEGVEREPARTEGGVKFRPPDPPISESNLLELTAVTATDVRARCVDLGITHRRDDNRSQSRRAAVGVEIVDASGERDLSLPFQLHVFSFTSGFLSATQCLRAAVPA